jgi:hypothetical protein
MCLEEHKGEMRTDLPGSMKRLSKARTKLRIGLKMVYAPAMRTVETAMRDAVESN